MLKHILLLACCLSWSFLPTLGGEQVVTTQDINDSSLNQEEFSAEALMAHNLYRKIHGVPAIKLNVKLIDLAVTRARELAKDGKLNVKQILFNKENLGETVGTVGGFSSYNGISATQLWYSVVSKFDEEGESSNEGASFTQMVWKKTREVGFGIAKGKDGKFYFVAEYFPSGNIRGEYEDNVFQLTDEDTTVSGDRSDNKKCVSQAVVDKWRNLLAKANIEHDKEAIVDQIEPKMTTTRMPDVPLVDVTVKPLKSKLPLIVDSESSSNDNKPDVAPVTTRRTIVVTSGGRGGDDLLVDEKTPIRTTTTQSVPVRTTTVVTEPSTTRRVHHTTTTAGSVVESTRKMVKISPIDRDSIITDEVDVDMPRTTTRRPVRTTTVRSTATTVNPDFLITLDSSLTDSTLPTVDDVEIITTTRRAIDQENDNVVATTRRSTSGERLTTEEHDQDVVVEKTTKKTTTASTKVVDDETVSVRTTTLRGRSSEVAKKHDGDREDDDIDHVKSVKTTTPASSSTSETTTRVVVDESSSTKEVAHKSDHNARMSPTQLDDASSQQRPSKSKLLETISKNADDRKPSRELSSDNDDEEKRSQDAPKRVDSSSSDRKKEKKRTQKQEE